MTIRSDLQIADASIEDRYVFLSYSSKDRDLALKLKHELKEYDVNVWIDVDRMRHGSLIINELEQAIEEACAFVVFVTADSLSSGWVREECGHAITLSIQSTFRLPVIPIAVEGAKIPGFLANRKALQLSDRNNLTAVAENIASVLSQNMMFTQKSKRKTMVRWHSRCKNFANGDVSVLAVAETLAAMALIIVLLSYSGSFTYLAVSALLAPLALLQSDQSRSIGIRWLKQLQWWTRLSSNDKNDSRIAKIIRTSTLVCISMGVVADFAQILPFLNSIMVGLIGIFIFIVFLGMTPPLMVRSAATLFVAIRHPINTLRAIPTNWKNLIISKDMLEEPEALPGYLDAVSTGELSSDLRIPDLIRGLARPIIPKVLCDCGVRAALHAYMLVFFALPAVILLYVPFYSARWALKSTAVIWAPLLWVASATNGSTYPLRLRLRILSEDATNKTTFVFSWLIIAFLLAIWQGFFLSLSDTSIVINWIILFAQQPIIQICAAGAALIAIGIHLSASRILILYSYKTLPENVINKAINVAIFLQRLMVFALLSISLIKLFDLSM